MTIFLSILMICCAMTLRAQQRPEAPAVADEDSTPAAGTRAFHRSDRPYGAKLGFASIRPNSKLGIQADVILLNDFAVEGAAGLYGFSARARYYILSGAFSPYFGIGTGMAFHDDDRWFGSWKEWHVGIEHAFATGIVIQAQLISFFDRRGAVLESYTIAPGIGYRF